ncbi:MAG: hypothetical protein WBW88_07460 [Rhodothermales bacterium]
MVGARNDDRTAARFVVSSIKLTGGQDIAQPGGEKYASCEKDDGMGKVEFNRTDYSPGDGRR